MTARVAVATARYGDPWDEVSVLAARLAGALACTAEVDVLVPAVRESCWDGACRVLRFPATLCDRRARAAWRRVALGVDGAVGLVACDCLGGTDPERGLPALVEEELVLAEGGDAPALYDHLRTNPYDATVFVGLHTPVTCFGLRALPAGCRAFIAPGAHDVGNDLRIHDAGLSKAERILVCTETERRRMAKRLGPGVADRVENLGFLLGVNPVVQPDPPDGGQERVVVIARDWRTIDSRGRYYPWAERMARRLPAGVTLRLVGPGAGKLAHGVPHTDARIDVWWWMSRAVAVADPAPHRVIGQEVLEALLLGVPVLVAANGDATREHAELGNGGLWYRTDDEFVASINRLLDTEIAGILGLQGRTYATARFANTDTYVKRVADLLG